ncbi:MAG: hypothetical protein Q9161_003263 [Pseudevernia consocians]
MSLRATTSGVNASYKSPFEVEDGPPSRVKKSFIGRSVLQTTDDDFYDHQTFKKAMLTYGPNGMSRGIATIIFNKPGSADDALVQLNGMLVDKRPMKVKLAKPASFMDHFLTSVKIEVVLNASKAAAVPVKGLGDRVTQGKNQPKSVAAKSATNGTATRGGRVGGRGARRGRNAGRPKAKTADELDAEMVDYFDANAANGTAATTDAAATVNGSAAPATNGEETGMDEIS